MINKHQRYISTTKRALYNGIAQQNLSSTGFINDITREDLSLTSVCTTWCKHSFTQVEIKTKNMLLELKTYLYIKNISVIQLKNKVMPYLKQIK